MTEADRNAAPADGISRRDLLTTSGMAIALAGLASPAEAAETAPATGRASATLLYPHESATRATRDLSGIWRFRLDPGDRGEAERWFDGLADTRAIPVPCSWNDLFDDAAHYFDTAWYETDVTIDAGWRGRAIFLRFGSAVYRARAWLNGVLLGEHVGGHLPFAFDIAGAGRIGEVNRLTVMVENKLRVDRVPAIPDAATSRFTQEDYPQTAYDFFPYSGLHRPVWLCSMPRDHIDDIVVTTGLSAGVGTVDVAVSVSGGWSGAATVELVGGDRPLRAPLAIRAGKGQVTIHVPAARAWGPQDPFLYRLVVTLGDTAAPVDQYALKIGIRTIAVDGEKLLLNGKPVQLRGFGKHEDFFLHGRGQDLAVLVRDFELLKWIGANSFRTSHYPYSEEAMMLADQYGFLVIGETPAVSLTFSDSDAVVAARHDQLLADIDALIARDRNHPCVILWSIANEPLTKPFHTSQDAPADVVAKGTRFFADMFARVRAADATRPVALVSVQGGPAEWVGQGDVICTNSYNGWYGVSGRIEDATVRLDQDLRAMRAKHGAKPFIVTEFGADAMAGIHAQPPEMWSEDYQSDLIAAYLATMAKLPFVVGTHPWAFADFKTAQSIMRVGALNLKGVFTRDRRPKEAARTLRRIWTGAAAD